MILEDTFEIIEPNAAEIVCLYALEHLDENFVFNRTYEKIQQDTGVSQPTINRFFKLAEENGLAKHIGKSKWSFADIMVRRTDVPDGRGFFIRALKP